MLIYNISIQVMEYHFQFGLIYFIIVPLNHVLIKFFTVIDCLNLLENTIMRYDQVILNISISNAQQISIIVVIKYLISVFSPPTLKFNANLRTI